MNKKTAIISLSLVAVLALSATAFARHGYHGGMGYGDGMGYGHGMGYGPGFQVAPEQQEAFDKIFDQHRETMRSLGNQLWAKRTELDALSVSGQADKNDIRGLVQEIAQLRDKQQREREAFFNELDGAGIDVDVAPCAGPRGRGWHHSGAGYGPGMGPGAANAPRNQ